MSLFDDIIKKCEKSWNCEDLMTGVMKHDNEKIPCSSLLVNHSLYGGIPRNKITEFCGEPGCGKSSTAIDICKNAVNLFQQEFDKDVELLREKSSKGDKQATIRLEDKLNSGRKKVLYLDLEHSFDKHWSDVLGINIDEINIMQPPDVFAEDILQKVQELIETGEVGLVVLDSIPSLVPKSELEKEYGERTVASLAGLLTIFCRKIVPLLTRCECTLLVINQVRENMDNPYVVKTPGGKALQFYCSLRVQFKLGVPVDFLGNEVPKSTENPAGYIINTKLLKQKSAPFDRKNASYFLMCQSGIRVDMDVAQLAMKKYGLIKKSAGWFALVDPTSGELLEEDGKPFKLNGISKVYQYLQSHSDYYNKLKSYIERDIGLRGSEEEEVTLASE